MSHAQLGVFDASAYADTGETNIRVAVIFNIIQIINISKSKLNQLDDWKELQDPNKVSMDRLCNSSRQGQPRLVTEVDVTDDASMRWGSSFVGNEPKVIYCLVLRDSAGNYCYAYDYNSSLLFLRGSDSSKSLLPIQLGGRLLVNSGTEVRCGVLLLTGGQCQYMGFHDDDRELIDLLNNGLVRKYIEILKLQVADPTE